VTEVAEDKPQFSLFGHGLFGDPVQPPKRGPLADRFIVSPFSVLNAREGAWQERKRAWIGLGIKSELGRGQNALNLSEQAMDRFAPGGEARYEARRGGGNESAAPSGRQRPECRLVDGRTVRGDGIGQPIEVPRASNPARSNGQDLMRGEHVVGEEGVQDASQTGTSIFDPVLCECAYRWFCPAGGQVLDPFAGGSVRGIVAGCLGRRYHGIDLRPEQVAANRVQAAAIPSANPAPEWAVGDSLDLLPEAPPADFIFSCPPYGDLERYSDDPRDLSTMEHHTFIATYKRIIMRACARLLPNRFACFVVGDFRDRKGHYRNFVSDTIAAFMEQGLAFYNEAILVTQVGSLPIRVGKQFAASRKLGRTHQQVLVFVKGDARKAAAACGDFDAPARPAVGVGAEAAGA
jgi:hypothetical protein